MSGNGEVMRFPVEMVRQHAGTVDRVSAGMEQARSAVREITMDTQAYGQLCQFLPGLLNPVFDMAVEALRDSVDALQETATRLRTAATGAGNTDAAGAQRLLAAGGGNGAGRS